MMANTIIGSELTSRLVELKEMTESNNLLEKLQQVHKDLEYYKNIDWYVHHGDLVIDGNFDNDIQLIVLGDITIKGNYNDDKAGTGYLVCDGDMRVQSLLSWNYFSIGQSLYATGFVGAYYNDYTFRVYGGNFQARAYCSFDRSFTVPNNPFAEIYFNSHADSEWQCKSPFYSIIVPEMSTFYDSEDEEISIEEAQQLIAKKGNLSGAAPEWEEANKSVNKNQIFLHDFQYSEAPNNLSLERLRYELMQENPPKEFYEAAYKLENLHVDLAHLRNTPKAIFEKLSTSAQDNVRQALASNASLPSQLLMDLSKDKTEAVREALVFNDAIREDIVNVLLKDESVLVHRALACTKNVLNDKTKFLNSDDLRTRQNMAANIYVGDVDRKNILLNEQSDVKEKALEKTIPNFENINKFIHSEDTTLQLWAFEKIFELEKEEQSKLLTEEQVLNHLYSENEKISAIALQNLVAPPFLSFKTFEKHTAHFAKSDLNIGRIRAAQISRQEEVLSLLAKDSVEIVRKSVVANYATPASVLLEMTKDICNQEEESSTFGMSKRESFVSFSLLKNPRLPEEAFLYIGKIIPQSYGIEPHPNLPPDLYLEYESNGNPFWFDKPEYEDLQKALQSDGNREELLAVMARSSGGDFIDFVAQSNYNSLETLSYIFNTFKRDKYTMRSLASNKSLGQESPLAEEIIKGLIEHEDDEVRAIFLKNPHVALERKIDVLNKEEDIYLRRDLKILYWQTYGIELDN